MGRYRNGQIDKMDGDVEMEGEGTMQQRRATSLRGQTSRLRLSWQKKAQAKSRVAAQDFCDFSLFYTFSPCFFVSRIVLTSTSIPIAK